jgi:hypothetical protein
LSIRGRAEGQEAIGLGVDLVDDEVGIVGVRIGDELVALLDQPLGVLGRNAHDLGEHQHGQAAGDDLHGVEFAQRQGFVQNAVDEGADLFLIGGDAPARKGRIEELANRGVLGRVGFLEGLARLVFLRRLVFHADALGRGQQARILVQGADVLLAGDRPEAPSAIGLRRPGHRIGPAQAVEGRKGRAFVEGVLRGKVHVRIG